MNRHSLQGPGSGPVHGLAAGDIIPFRVSRALGLIGWSPTGEWLVATPRRELAPLSPCLCFDSIFKDRVAGLVRSCANEKAFEGLAALRFCHRKSHHIIDAANLLGCGVREDQFARTTWGRGGDTCASSSRAGKPPIVSYPVVFLALYVIIGQLGVSMQRTKCKADTCTMLIRASQPFFNTSSFSDWEGGSGCHQAKTPISFHQPAFPPVAFSTFAWRPPCENNGFCGREAATRCCCQEDQSP